MRPPDFAAIRQRVSVLAVLGLLRWRRVRVEGGWERGGCPVHQRGREHGDCFAARPEGWICHSCGRHGDALRLWAEATDQPLMAAAVDLCQRLGVELPTLPRRPRKPRDPRTRGEAR